MISKYEMKEIVRRAMAGLRWVNVADRKLAEEMKVTHLRGGKVTARHCGGLTERRFVLDKPAAAIGYDELGNMIYVDGAGFIKQVF